MRFSTVITAIILALLPSGFSAPTPPRSLSEDAGHLFGKRQSFGGRATFYDVGLGACGGYNVASDYIVALNAPQYGGGYPGPQCGKTITISYGGKTAQATIRDLCPGCGFGDLDMSRGLFNHFSDEGAGVFQMNWWFNDGSNSGGGQQQESKPEPTTSAWTPPPTPTTRSRAPTSTWTPEPEPESTYTPPTPTSSSSSQRNNEDTPSSSASASSSASTGSTGGNASASDGAVSVTVSGSVVSAPLSTSVTGMGNLALLNQIVTNLGAVIIAGAETE